jgi:NADH:ubiquinone reductase (H+-translocating)
MDHTNRLSRNSAHDSDVRSRVPVVVIIGGGFGGVATARGLRKSAAEVVLIDRRNHHIFQPLLYQVATSVLSPSDIAAPIRQLVRRQRNLTVVMGEAISADFEASTVRIMSADIGVFDLPFDYLVVAAGMRPSYFGHDDFAAHAPGLKTLADAEAIRAKILRAYEVAEITNDPRERARLLTFILVGAGPTGVELAASIAQMATLTLRTDFRRIDPIKTTIILIEGGSRILPSFHEFLSAKATAHLEKIGVKVMTHAIVEKVDEAGVIVGGERIESATVIWTAGVEPSPIVKSLAAPKDRQGRIEVDGHMNIPDRPQVFVVGDAATFTENGRVLPGVAQVALQQGRYVGSRIAAELAGRSINRVFHYHDRGNMAVVGKNFAVMETRRIRLHGLLSWLAWAMIHVMFLPQLQNRLRVQIQWAWTYFTGQRGSRIIPESQTLARYEAEQS